MYQILKKSLIPNFEQTTNPDVRLRYGTVAGALGIVSNAVLFVLKLVIGLMVGSVSVLADAINNLSDAGSSIVTLVGFKLAGKHADAEHPFGHARYEYISGFVVAFVVLVIGVLLAKSSVEKIISPEPIDSTPLAIGLLAFAIAAKLWQAGLYGNFGRAIDSTSLMASAVDSRNDVISTTVVLLSVIAAKIWPTLAIDGVMGLLVSAFILISGVKLLRETLDPLLGTVPDQEVVRALSEKVLSYKGIVGVHDLMIHSYGPANQFASIHAEVPAEQDILTSHDIIDTIEQDVMNQLGIFLVIHMDPVITGNPEVDRLKQKSMEAIVQIAGEKATLHDFRCVFGNTHTNILFDVVLPFDSPWTKQSLEERLSETFNQVPSEEPPNHPTSEGHRYFFVLHIDKDFTGTAKDS